MDFCDRKGVPIAKVGEGVEVAQLQEGISHNGVPMIFQDGKRNLQLRLILPNVSAPIMCVLNCTYEGVDIRGVIVGVRVAAGFVAWIRIRT